MFQVRIHGGGGQGAVTAAEFLSVAAFEQGRHAQAFPSFGSERTCAPVVAFCRIDVCPNRIREPILAPDALIVQDPTLLHQVELFDERMMTGRPGIFAGGDMVPAERTVRPQLEAVRRRSTFDEVGCGLDEPIAKFEARRCLSCGNCFACDNCFGVYPDNAVIKLDEPGPYRYEIDLDFSKGCGLCVAECPAGAIEMEPERI
jgi:Pyruvate/2-oxoacid:ferredoxin oxidoreductase delta subunit